MDSSMPQVPRAGSGGGIRSTYRTCGLVTLLTAVLMLVGQPALAQKITATLSGTVTDATGAVIVNAEVKILNEGTQASTELHTNKLGRFLAPALPPGSYTLQIKATGFKQLEQRDIKLLVDQTLDLNLSLATGSVSDTVVVEAQVPLLNTETSDRGAVVETKEILNLPLNQRDPYSLVFLTPGVSGTTSEYFGGLTFSVNGARKQSADILIDGVSSVPPTDGANMGAVFPSVDAVQEFKVQTSSYSAEFGQAGGGIINVLLKSGTNGFHGSAYDFLRNSEMDANNFFNNRNHLKRGTFQRNQFGGTVGGPVLIPGLYDGHGKTFFFFSYEGLRQRSQSNLITTVPTLAMRQGDFTGLTTADGKPITIYDPNTTTYDGKVWRRSEFAQHNIIPLDRINPVAANVMKYYPLPNLPGSVNNYVATGSTPSNTNQVDAKIDQAITPKQHISLSYSQRNPFNGVAPFFPAEARIAQNGSVVRANAIGGVLNYTYAITPTDLFEMRYGQYSLNYKTSALGDGFDPTQLGMPAYIRDNAHILQFPGFEATGYVSLGSGAQIAEGAAKWSTNSFTVSNTKIFSKHTLKVGFETRLMRNKSNQIGRSTGDYFFTKALTQGPDPTIGSTTTGDGFASLLLGVGNNGTLTHNFKIVDTTSRYLAGYAQDDWKVTSRLTLNLGVRYEVFMPRKEKYGRSSWFDPYIISPLAKATKLNLTGGLAFPSVNDNPDTQTDLQMSNIGPRLGLAYKVTNRVVVRTGVGIFYANAPNEAASTVAQFGYRTDTPYTGTSDNGIHQTSISDPFPNGFLPITGNSAGALTAVGTSISSVLRHSPTPYSDQATLGVQYELPQKWLLDVAYVGTRGLQLIHTLNSNQLPNQYLSMGSQLTEMVPNPFYGTGVASGALSGQTVQRRYLLTPYPQYTGVNLMYAPGVYSKYDSIQIQLQKQLDRNLSVRLAFTGSKWMDNCSCQGSNNNGNGTSQDATNLRNDWSLSTADVPRQFVGAVVYSLPFGRGQKVGRSWRPAVNAALGGWTVNTLLSIQSGTPLSLSATNNNNNFGPGERPNWNGQDPNIDGPIYYRLSKYFNTAAFSQPVPYTYGNTSRTLPNLRAPGVRNIDLSLFKEFAVAERLKAQLRLEAFNALNTPQFGAPDTNLSSATFGVISSQANTPRQVQVALKLLF